MAAFDSKTCFYIVIVGLDNAGKTTFLEQTKVKFSKDYQMLNPLKITSTVGLNIGKIEFGSVRLNFWDLGGQEELHSLWQKYFDDCHAVIFVIDSCDTQRFKEAKNAFNSILENKAVQRLPILVVCNKYDLEECVEVDMIKEIVSDDRHSGDLALVTVSALEGLNIDRCVRWILIVLRNKLNGFYPNDG